MAAAPTTERVSVSSSDAEVRAGGVGAAISHTGRYVVFASEAGLLAPFDGPGSDVFIRDRRLGTTRTVPDSFGGGGASISANARRIAFMRTSAGPMPGDPSRVDVVVRDMRRGTTTRVTPPGGQQTSQSNIYNASLSADGHYVAFVSSSPDWVGGDTNGKWDVFLHDRRSGITRLISAALGGGPANGDSYPGVPDAGGRHVAFWSSATNLVRGDRNRRPDLFVHDRVTGKTVRASVSSSGQEAAVPRGFVARGASISADGRRVVFTSKAENLVPGDTNHRADVFVHDLRSGRTTRVSVTSTGEQVCENQPEPMSDHCNTSGDISADGQRVVFSSDAPDLVPGDENRATDVFLHDLRLHRTMRVSVDSAGSEICERRSGQGCTGQPAISGDGRYVTFESDAADVVPDDTNRRRDVFLRGPL